MEEELQIEQVSPEEVEEKPKPKDDFSDLFDAYIEPDTEDVVSVDIDKDVIDTDEDGTIDSLTEVSEEDVMGDELGQSDLDYKPKPRYRVVPRRRIRYVPPDGMGGLSA